MKKLTLSLLMAAMLLPGLQPVSAAPRDYEIPKVKNMSIEVLVDARRVAFPDERPRIANGTTFVPLRFVSDKLGGTLNLKGKDITIVKGDRTVKLTIGAKTATVNGKTVTLDKASYAVNGRTLVPLRFVSEALGEKVKWDAPNQYIWIGSTEVPTLEEISNPEPIEPYLKFYKQADHLIDLGYKKLDKVRILSKDDFPVKFERQTMYRIDYAVMSNGLEYMRSVSDSKGVLGTGIILLQENEPAKLRGEVIYLRERVDGFPDYRVKYHNIVDGKDRHVLGIEDYEEILLKDLDYIALGVDADAAVLIKNDFTN